MGRAGLAISRGPTARQKRRAGLAIAARPKPPILRISVPVSSG